MIDCICVENMRQSDAFTIEKVMPKVKPDTNAAEILKYLEGK